jgi:hypothetical protein
MPYGVQVNSASSASGATTTTTHENLHPGVLLQQGYVVLTSTGATDGSFNFYWNTGTVVVNFSANAGSYTKFGVVINNTGTGGTYDGQYTGLSGLAMAAAPTATVNLASKTVTFTIGPTFRVNTPSFNSGVNVKLVNTYYYLIFGIG